MYLEDGLSMEINKSVGKAVIQAIIIPGIVFVILLVFKTEWAGLSFLYWLLPMVVYSTVKRRDMTKKIFYRILSSILMVVLIFALLIIS